MPRCSAPPGGPGNPGPDGSHPAVEPDDDAGRAVRDRVRVAAGVLMTRGGLDEHAVLRLITDEWTARDLPLDVVVHQLLYEAADPGDR